MRRGDNSCAYSQYPGCTTPIVASFFTSRTLVKISKLLWQRMVETGIFNFWSETIFLCMQLVASFHKVPYRYAVKWCKPSDHLNSSIVTIINFLPKVIRSSNTTSTFKKLLTYHIFLHWFLAYITCVQFLWCLFLFLVCFFILFSLAHEEHFFRRMIMMPIQVLKKHKKKEIKPE